jgi:copper chaperone
MTTLTLTIAGMSCDHCTASVREALLRLPGVASAEVSLEQKQATVAFDPARVDRERLRAAIEAIGFELV